MQLRSTWFASHRRASFVGVLATILVALALVPGTFRTARGQISTLPPPIFFPEPCVTVATALGTVQACGINLPAGTSLTIAVTGSTQTSVTVLIQASNGPGSAGGTVLVCLNTTTCQVVTLGPTGSVSVTLGTPPPGVVTPPPVVVPCVTATATLGTVQVCGLGFDAGVTVTATVRLATTTSVTVFIQASNGPGSAGRLVQVCLVGVVCQTQTLGADGTLVVTLVSYTSGWNLVGVLAGTVLAQANGPLYTYDPAGGQYMPVPNTTPLKAGVGYWAYFTAATTVIMPGSASLPLTLTLPVGAYLMIGNPGSTTVTVTGADVVYTYDQTAGYQATTTLKPGQGAWAFSYSGATITLQ